MERQATDAPSALVLAHLGTVMRRAFSARMAAEAWAVDAGMRPGCFSVLRAVALAEEPPSQRALCDRLGIDPSDMVGLVDTLEQAGFLTRERHPADRRRHALRVAPAGTEALGRFDRIAASVGDDVFGVLDPPDRAVLERLLAQVVHAHETPGSDPAE